MADDLTDAELVQAIATRPAWYALDGISVHTYVKLTLAERDRICALAAQSENKDTPSEIDALVAYVETRADDLGGTLHLTSRVFDGAKYTKSELRFADAPGEVAALNGLPVWSGGDGRVMLGDIMIAKRSGRFMINFVDRNTFLSAIAAWHAGESADEQRQYISAELAEINALRDSLPNGDVIVHMSLTSRRESLMRELAALDDEGAKITKQTEDKYLAESSEWCCPWCGELNPPTHFSCGDCGLIKEAK